MHAPSLKSSRGFTLIEMLVYIAIFTVLSILAIQAMSLMTRAFTDLRVSRDLNSSGSALFERMSRDIRGAYDIDEAQSTLASSPGRLTLNTKDALGVNTTVEFYVEGGVVKIKEGGVAQGVIMTTSTSIDNFVVRKISGTNTDAVKVEATITASRGGITKTRNFYTTATLRGTY
jgi:prepilin-type N-terminal cleavage/methylation domain-containing protein